MNGSNSWVKYLLGFVAGVLAGCVAATAVFYLSVVPSMKRIASKLNEARHHEDTFLQSRADSLSADLQTCQSKFNRATFLYDVGVLGGETRAWAIPADIVPLVVGQKRGSYSYFDPKTQTETVHFQAKTQ